ncbi:MAG: YihY/virulence factor BrkB family protein [Rhizobiaceae bacterium]|nr:YihY/virulence factor BrkB family protein [Rhizobiaceae bacterium]
MLTILWQSFYRATVKLIYDGGMAIASNVALSLLLSLFPFLMLIASLVRLYGDPSMAQEIVQLVFGAWPGDSAEAITEQVRVLLSQSPGEFFSLSTLVALVLATNGIESARDGLNRAYKVTERRSFLWRRSQGCAFILLGAVALIASNIILVGAPFVWLFLVVRFEWLKEFVIAYRLVQFGLPLTVLLFSLYAFHRFLPDLKGRRRRLMPGILITLIAIAIGSNLFGLYLKNIANYTALYAGLAGIMVAIVYLYGLAVLLLFGAEFNTALAELRSGDSGGDGGDGGENGGDGDDGGLKNTVIADADDGAGQGERATSG